MRRTVKVLLLVLMLLLAIASVWIIATFLILEWPRAARAGDRSAERMKLTSREVPPSCRKAWLASPNKVGST